MRGRIWHLMTTVAGLRWGMRTSSGYSDVAPAFAFFSFGFFSWPA